MAPVDLSNSSGDPAQHKVELEEQKSPEQGWRGASGPLGALGPLALLADTAAGLLAGSDPIERVYEFFQRFSDQLGLEIFVQYNVSADGNHLDLNSWAGIPEKYYPLLKSLEFGQAVCGTVAQTRQPMYVNHIQAAADRKTELIRRIGIGTYACHPLIANGRLLGTLSFGSRRLSEFDEQTIYLLRTFCQMVASALERKQAEQKRMEALTEAEHEKNRFLAVMEALPIGLAIYDQNGGDVLANRGYEEIWGSPRPAVHSIEDYPMYQAWWADSGRPVQPEEWASARAFKNGETVTGQVIEIQGFDGIRRIILNSGAPIRDAHGQITGSAVAIMDITERRQIEEALAASERKYRELVKYAPTAIYEIDFRTFRFTTINDAMVAMSGYSREELLKMSPFDLLDEPSRARLQERTQQWQSGEQPGGNVEYRFKRKDGSLRSVVLNTTFIADENGRPLAASVIAHDITERKQTEEALRESESRLAIVFDSLPVGVGLVDTDGKLLLANQEMRRFMPNGMIPSRDAASYGRWRGYHPDGQRIERIDYPGARALRGERVLPGVEFLYEQEDGSEVWTSFAALPIKNSEGQITGVTSVITDVDVPKRAAEALRKSEERFRSSIESLSVGFSILSAVRVEGEIADFRNEYVNEMTCRLGHRSRDQVVGHTLLELFPQFREDKLFTKYIQVVETGQPLVEQAYPYADVPGIQPHLSGRFDVHAVKFGDGLIVTLDDVTEQVRLEAENQKAIQEREIHHRLAEQREKERQSIARDLHDGPIQTLSSLAFTLQFLKEAFADPKLQLELSQIALSVKGSVQELRQVMNELRPPTVIRFGLAKAIQMHAESLGERYPQIAWNVELDQDGQILPAQTCLALFRIYQEAINNIIRHSEATDAWIQFHVDQDQVTLDISDNGKGFENTQDIIALTNNQHFGLAGIAERVQSIDGAFEIQSRPGDGTTIRLSVPIVKQE